MMLSVPTITMRCELIFPKALIILLFCSCCHQGCASSRNNVVVTLSPISGWQASWTASQAQGTAVAMTIGDCLVLFSRSPSTNVYKPSLDIITVREEDRDDDTNYLHGLRVERIEKDQPYTRNSMIQYAPSWITVGSNSICAMTGLALDVEHLCRVLQKFNDDHYNTYQKSLTTHVMTQRLAKLLQSVCLSQGGRPFGVQAMIIGCDDDIDDSDNNDGLCIYSMDPSGSWQSWGRATAIGKYGLDVRRILSKKLQSPSSSNMNLQDAVECLIECWKETCQQQNIAASNNAKEDYQVLVLRKDPKDSTKSLLYRVPSEEMNRILEKVDNKLEENEA